jgi:hypothetical protein
VIAAIDASLFAKAGAQSLRDGVYQDGVYILPRKYDGTPSGETCAIVGIARRHIRELFNQSGRIYNLLRGCPLLRDVPGIADLGPYKLGALKCMLRNLYFVLDSELVLFNIEPKGEDGNEKLYPRANICLPGGGMEIQDDYSWERCALREFEEEVGVKLDKEDKLIARQRFTFQDRQAMYYWYRLTKFQLNSPA